MSVDDSDLKQANSILYKQLREELDLILGYYAFGRETYIRPDLPKSVEASTVQSHEDYHRELCLFTPYGQLQTLALNILKSNPQPKISNSFLILSESLITNSYLTHEGLALFNPYLLGVKDTVEGINYRANLAPEYQRAFDLFNTLYVTYGPSKYICDWLFSFMTFSIAWASMSCKDYLSKINNLDERSIQSYVNFLSVNGPDQKLKKLIDRACIMDSWNSILNSLLTIIDQHLADHGQRRNGKITLPDLLTSIHVSLDYRGLHEYFDRLLAPVRKSLRDMLAEDDIPAYADYREWQDDREAMLENWKSYYRIYGVELKCPVSFQKEGHIADDTNLGVLSDRRLDFDTPHEYSIYPEDYTGLKRFRSVFQKEISDGKSTILLDLISLDHWDNVFSGGKLDGYYLVFTMLFKSENKQWLVPKRHLVFVGKHDEVVSLFQLNQVKLLTVLHSDHIGSLYKSLPKIGGMVRIYWYEDVLNLERLKLLENMCETSTGKWHMGFYRNSSVNPAYFTVLSELNGGQQNRFIFYILEESLWEFSSRVESMRMRYKDRLFSSDDEFIGKEDIETENMAAALYMATKFSMLAYDKEMVLGLACGIDENDLKMKLKPILGQPVV